MPGTSPRFRRIVPRKLEAAVPACVWVACLMTGNVMPAMAVTTANLATIMLPTSFIGEAATLALAFAAPALAAGAYLLLKRAVHTVGMPAAVGVGMATAVGGIALALGANSQMLTKLAGL
jgi:hypothetical protein